MNDKRGSFKRRMVDLAAVAMIGDGALGVLVPTQHMQTWADGPQPWREMVDFFFQRPWLTRFVGAAEIGVALWWARRSLGGS